MHEWQLHLTPDERAAYRERLPRLIEVENPAVEERLRRLRALGEDLDEDEYDNALDDQAGIDGAIHYLPKLLARAGSISAADAERAEYVRLGSRVVARTANGATVTYQIAGPFSADWVRGQPISCNSPIGNALMGGRPGEIVHIETPAQSYALHIIAVEQSSGV